MTKTEAKQLGKTLWEIADTLRGSMDADDFRDYMLSFIFLRYLSLHYEEVAKERLKDKYPVVSEDEKKSPLVIWYENNPESIEKLEDTIKRITNYIIKPEYLWSNIVKLAEVEDEQLAETIKKAFTYIEEKSFGSEYKNLFSEIDLNSVKLGKTGPDKNKTLCKVVCSIDKGFRKFHTDTDIIGDAYEYLIEKFASGSGKKAGEFYTPQEVSSVLSRIVILDSQDPTTGKREKIGDTLDFACGSGSLLLNVKKNAVQKMGKIYGQEKNITTYNLARMNMILHQVQTTNFEIYHGDTLTNDWDILTEENPSSKKKFDIVVANPPFSYRWQPEDSASQDFRFMNYGVAPKTAADFAFLLHGFHYLSDEGTMAIILPHGVLFRSGAEERIRTKLLKDGNIDTIIGLPPNLFFSTGIPVCIIVLKKCKKPNDVLFINASEHFEKEKRQNKLREQDIDKIVETYQYRKEESRYSRRVSMEEIEQNGYNLNISRYISTAVEEPLIDLKEVTEQLKQINQRIQQTTNKHNTFLKELGLEPLP
ncbi:MAG: type I restriction-modification system subunit M [Capnocytophaga sp.]|nr:type I restriction-modification system subunit M [Capnocytophaga sp.]